ncbi:hypothetical protein [Streptomyces formicae]
MTRYGLDQELTRTEGRPNEVPIHLLALLRVKPVISGPEYATRLREVIQEALRVCKRVDFAEDDVPVDSLPDWFLSVTDGTPDTPDANSPESIGKSRYLAARENEAWEAEEWIYCFDPDLRAWSWWDVTEDDRGNVSLWVDTKGEGHVPCEELWWAVYVAGAESVEPLTLQYSSEWAAQASIGT